jgi:energy-coupling factor transporter ATP-binding protein EcfA2
MTGALSLAPEHLAPGALATELPPDPFVGLRPFRVQECTIFFGRETVVDDIASRLRSTGVVFVHGSSGCGKSSLIYAGVLPSVARRARRLKRDYRVVQMRPGRTPLRTLAHALTEACGVADQEKVWRILAKGESGAAELHALIQEAGVDRLYLFVDQFEELFRFASSDTTAEAALFAEVVIGLGGGKRDLPWWKTEDLSEEELEASADLLPEPEGPVRLLITMRSEFLGDSVQFPGLPELINRSQYLLPAIGPEDLIRAIREPAFSFDSSVDLDLADRLASDAAGERDPLPLVQHALSRLWSAGREMTLARYLALGGEAAPGVQGSCLNRLLSRHADEVLASTGGGERVAEPLFRALTEVDPQGRAIRRPRVLSELIAVVGPADEEALREMIDKFRAASFLRPFPFEVEGRLAPEQMIDISHETLIRAWPRIADLTLDPETGKGRGWLRREVEDGLFWRALAVQARIFDQNNDACLDAATTDRMEPWFLGVGGNAAWTQRHLIERKGVSPDAEPEWLSVKALIEASAGNRDRKRRRRRISLVILAVFGALFVLSLALTTYYARVAEDRALIAESIALGAKRDAQRRFAYQAVQSEQALQGQASLERQALEPAATTIDTMEGYLWLGSDRIPKIVGGTPSRARPGDSYVVSSAMTLRSAPPNPETYALADGVAPLEQGVAVRILSPPRAFKRDQTQYWAQVQTRAVIPTVFVQFYGGDATDPDALAASRKTVADFAADLQSYAYKVPGQQRLASARGLYEVRYFRAEDLKAAQTLAANCWRAQRKRVGPNAPPPQLKDFRNYSGEKPPAGVLELWVDLGRISTAQAARGAATADGG